VPKIQLAGNYLPGEAEVLRINFQYLGRKFSYQAIQGADNKLGQFLSLDIYATANHRNCLQHSLES
jgi:hypothetical protein